MNTSKTERQKKIKAFTREWCKDATELRLSYAPKVGACNECNAPTISGLCCETCGSGSGCHDEEGNRV